MKIKIILTLLTFLSLSEGVFAQKKNVFVFQIRSEIDPRMSRYVHLAIEEAKEKKADVILIDMDTFGGAVDDADKIRKAILDVKVPIYVFINKNAASAGALISIACDSIYMQAGSSIGAATVVNGEDGSQAPDKYQSYMRSMMRSTAEATNRNPKIAEAFVDADIKLDSTIKKNGKVLTFSTSEAIKYHFCEAQVATISDILKRSNITDYEILNFELSWSEKIIALFLNPAISGILILIMLGGLYFELQSPGLGFPIIAAIVAALLYFTPYYMNGLAQNWEILCFFIGIVLLGLEIFVIPGFGVVGIAGILLIFMSLILSMLNNDFFNFDYVKANDLNYAMGVVATAFVLTVALLFYAGSKMLNSKRFEKIAQTGQKIENLSQTQGDFSSFMQQIAVAKTVLRPSGKIDYNGETYDAFSTGEYILEKENVQIIGYFNGAFKVKKA